MGKHILTATNITTNPINNSVAEYACVDIQCIGSNSLKTTAPTTNFSETGINRSIYERLQIQSHEQQHPKQHQTSTTKQTSKTKNTSNKMSNNGNTNHHHSSSRAQQPPNSYNLGNYFPRVSSEPTSRKNYQASARERDLKVGTISLANVKFSSITTGWVIRTLCLPYRVFLKR